MMWGRCAHSTSARIYLWCLQSFLSRRKLHTRFCRTRIQAYKCKILTFNGRWKMKVHTISKVFLIIALTIIAILSIFVISDLYFSQHDIPKKEDYLTTKLQTYLSCQISYHADKGHFFERGLEESACVSFAGIKNFFRRGLRSITRRQNRLPANATLRA